MAGNENIWEQPLSPPSPLFAGKPEKDLVKQINDELIEKVIGQQILYYPIDVDNSNYHAIYGECIVKNFLSPIRIYCMVEWEGQETETKPLIERRTKIKVWLHTRRLTEDQDLYVRQGDFIRYGNDFFEITKISDNRLLYGQSNSPFEISVECVYTREGVFDSN